MEDSSKWASSVLRDVFATFLFSQGNLPAPTTLAVRTVCRSWRDNVFTLSATVRDLVWKSQQNRIIGAAKRFSRLRLLGMSTQSLVECAAVFAQFSRLTALVLEQNPYSDNTLSILLSAIASTCKQLRSITFRNCHLGPTGAEIICDALMQSPYCPRELFIAESWIDSRGLAAFAAAFADGRASTRLERLEFDRHSFDPSAIRGFLSALHGSGVPPNLKILRISGPWSFKVELDLLCNLLNNNGVLEELHLDGLGTEEAPQFDFEQFSNTCLRVLSVPCNSRNASPGIISLCSQMKALECLNFGGRVINVETVASFSRLLSPGRSSSLHTLILDQCELGPRDASALFDILSRSPNLGALSVEGVFDHHTHFRILRRLLSATHLTSLNVSNSKLSYSEERELAELIQTSKTLKTLRLANCAMRGSVDRLASAIEDAQSLEEFDLSGNFIDERSVASIARALRSRRTLRSVNFASMKIGFPSVSAISAMVANCPCLTHLSLAGNEYNDDGVEMLCRGLKASASLSSLALTAADRANNGIALLSDYLAETRFLSKLHLIFQNDPAQKERDILLKALCHNRSLWLITFSVEEVAQWADFAAAVRAGSQRGVRLVPGSAVHLQLGD